VPQKNRSKKNKVHFLCLVRREDDKGASCKISRRQMRMILLSFSSWHIKMNNFTEAISPDLLSRITTIQVKKEIYPSSMGCYLLCTIQRLFMI
jgi:hypothetical protein